jgi:hypothetical protein
MLLIKGEVNKSILVSVIGRATQADIVVYHNDMLPFEQEYIVIDSDLHPQKFVCDYIKSKYMLGQSYLTEYLIIYTNFPEHQLKELIDFINKNERDILARSVLVTSR